MGCGGSKVEELEVVALCRGRTELLADAIRHRYALADAHRNYSHSLRSVAASLHRLLLLLVDGADASATQSSPFLPLPAHRKVAPSPPPPPPIASADRHSHYHSHSHSHSGSHIDFRSSDSDSDLHSGDSSPIHLHPDDYGPAETLGAGPTDATFYNLNYAKSKPPPPSVSYEYTPDDSYPSSSYSYYGQTSQNPNPDPLSYSYPYPPPNYYGYTGGGFFGSSSPPPPAAVIPPPAAAEEASSSTSQKPPPPPPSPPRASPWDFLNPFGGAQENRYYPNYASSRSSKDVRDEEGIPDLEDEEEPEVVKEAYGDQKFVASTSAAAPEEYTTKVEERVSGGGGETSHFQTRSAGVAEYEKEVVVDKNVVGSEVQRRQERRRNLNVAEVANEIKVQFDRAAESAVELDGLLEVGKHPYHGRISVYEVSSRMMCVLPSSNVKDEDTLNFEEDVERSLSCTLHKLYIWETKLHDEVRAEEKMRLLHDRNCDRLKRLDETGAEAHKIDATERLIKKLSTKIRIAIQVVETISRTISKLRDEELWPQINELIKGLAKMWKVILECHQIQSQDISEAKGLGSIAFGGKLNDTHMDALMQLELELLRWIGHFSDWINAQKNYVKALNGWLVLCLHYEPELTDDGVPPYSPGSIGAPPVFIICNYWSQAMDRISEKDVIDAMYAFATNLQQIWEQHRVVQQQKMMTNRETDGRLKVRDKEAQIIHKEVDALNKKLILVPGQNDLIHQSQPSEASNLQFGLRRIFEVMGHFAAESLEAYEKLQKCSEEERLARNNAEVL